jgi:hypothetical protein
MTTLAFDPTDPIAPTETDARLAREAARRIAPKTSRPPSYSGSRRARGRQADPTDSAFHSLRMEWLRACTVICRC